MKAAALALALGGLLAGQAGAQTCRLALALALDVSSSVDAREYALQRDGIVYALGDPQVQDALFAGPEHVALAVFEWSGAAEQVLVLDWTRLRTPADLDRVRARLGAVARIHSELPTALGEALVYADFLFRSAPKDCLFHTLDVSGDGRSNEGADPGRVYALLGWDRITVNGLAVGGELEGVDAYYRDELIRGPGAFIEIADNYDDFAETMRRKLIRELGVQVLGRLDP